MVPHFRYVGYDGHYYMFQCLSCYSKFSGNDGYVYCPLCGIKWESLLKCRSQEQPAWHYNLYGDWNTEAGIPSLKYNSERHNDWFVYEYIKGNKESLKMANSDRLRNYKATEVLDYLKRARMLDDADKFEGIKYVTVVEFGGQKREFEQ